MWTVATSYLALPPPHMWSRNNLLLMLPNYLIVRPDGLWEFGHAVEQSGEFSKGYLLAAIGKIKVPSWIQLV